MDAAEIARLIEPVLDVGRSRRIADITNVLRSLRHLLNAQGCIFWLWTEQGGPDSCLFAAAEDFEPNTNGPTDPFWHYLDPNSPSSCAVRTDTPRNFRSFPVPGIELHETDRRMMETLEIKSFCTVPVRWPNAAPEDQPIGAVNFYRRDSEPFSEPEFELAQVLARLVPRLLSDLVNHASFHLLRHVSGLLRDAQSTEGNSPRSQPLPFERTLKEVLEAVQETLNCLECSVYLIRDQNNDGAVHLAAGIWPWQNLAQAQKYALGVGLTGYCAARNLPLCIFNLGSFHQDRELIRKKYPGIDWSLTFNLEEAAREILPKNAEGLLPPLSFLAAPIVDGGRVLGVLRCCTARSAPHYFNQRQLELLCLVASLIGESCGGSFRLTRAQQERQWLQAFVQGITQLNGRAVEATTQRRSLTSLYTRALETLENAVPDAYALSVHLVSDDASSLVFQDGRGSGWTVGSSSQMQRRKNTRLPLNSAISAPVAAFNDNIVVNANPVASSRYATTVFPECTALIAAPISHGSKKYGVLSVVFNAPSPIFDQTLSIAALLGRQLGLYRFLGETIADLRTKGDELEHTVEVQRQAFENLNHQLKTPIFLAHRAIRRLMLRPDMVALSPDIPRLKGQIRRAEQVVTNIRMFYDLARGRPIYTNRSYVRPPKLLERVADTVLGHSQFAIDPSRGIQFSLDSDSFRALDQANALVRLDLELLDQMLDDLLDNAEKYGDPRTTVSVRAGLVQRGQALYIAVSNSGKSAPIDPEEARTLAARGQRGDAAVWRRHEGSGLGLYIVREILEAHGGKLEIHPTTEQSVTEFRLVFPTSATEGHL